MNASLVAVGRIMLGLFFVASGALKFVGVTDAGGLAPLSAYIANHGLPAPSVLAALVVAFEIVAGLAITLNRFVLPASLLLAAFCLVTAVVFHRFWSVPLDQLTGQLYQFMKNIGLAGAFILLAGHGTRS
jgi:putative oxidoreductase